MYKNKFISIIVLICLVLSSSILFTGCRPDTKQRGGSKPGKEKSPAYEVMVTQVTHSLMSMPLYIAAEKGFFDKEGLQVEVQTTWSRDKAVEDLLNKKAHILLDYPETLLYLVQQGSSDIVCFAQTAAATGCFLVARENKKPFAWQDLKGKIVIGYKGGELPEIIFEYILKSNNLRPQHNIHIIQNLAYQAFQGVFQAGTGHYILAAEPTASKMEKEDGSIVVASIEASSGPLVTATCITTRDYLKSHREACLKFTRALCQGLKWLDENSPEEIVAAAKKYFPAENEPVLLRAVSRYKTLGCWSSSPLVDRDGLNRLQEIMLKESELNNPIPPDALIDNSLAEEAVSLK